jgi:hypothetical protein
MNFASLESQHFLRWAIYAVIGAMTAGCGAPVALLANPDEDIGLKYVRPAGFKLSGTKAVWIDNPSIHVTYGYKVQRGFENTPPSPALVKRVQDDARNLVTMLRSQMPGALQAALEKSGVQSGDDHKIEMQPTRAHHLDGNLGMQIMINVKVIDREGKSLWSTVVPAKRPYNVIGIDLKNQDKAYISTTLEMLLARMRKADLLR